MQPVMSRYPPHFFNYLFFLYLYPKCYPPPLRLYYHALHLLLVHPTPLLISHTYRIKQLVLPTSSLPSWHWSHSNTTNTTSNPNSNTTFNISIYSSTNHYTYNNTTFLLLRWRSTFNHNILLTSRSYMFLHAQHIDLHYSY